MIWRLFSVALIAWVLGFALFTVALPRPAPDGLVTDAVVVPTGAPGRIGSVVYSSSRFGLSYSPATDIVSSGRSRQFGGSAYHPEVRRAGTWSSLVCPSARRVSRQILRSWNTSAMAAISAWRRSSTLRLS